MQLEIELTSLSKETDEASAERRAGDRARARRAARALGCHEGAVAGARSRRSRGSQSSRSASSRRAWKPSAHEREADLERASELRYGDIPELRAPARRARIGRGRARRGPRGGWGGRAAIPQGGGRRRRHRRGRRALDGHPGQPPAGGRDREADPHGGAPARARRRPGRGGRGGRHRAAPLARRPAGPRPPDRLVPVPRPDRRRQDRARARARRVHVRLAGRDGPHRHVRVHGEALRRAARRRAPRLRRLRRGRPADRGRAPPALRGRAAGRDREGTPGRVQHAAAGDGRRAPHRRPGSHGRLQEHRPDHDLQPARASRSR